MLKSFKTEINPTEEQKVKICQTIGVCRYVYNFYISHNKELYDDGKKFMSGKDFGVWLNNEYLPNHEDKSWIKEVSSKSVKKSIEDANTAFSRFFDGLGKYPRYKKKGKNESKMYFVRNNPTDCLCERHRIKIPTLGWVSLKEKGYIPTSKQGYVIRSGTVSIHAGRYYVSVLIDVGDIKPPVKIRPVKAKTGYGIDLGVKDLAVVSNGMVYRNINKTRRIKKLEKQLRREQRSLSRMYNNKKEKGGATQSNIYKQKLKVQKLYQRITNIRTDYINKTISEIVKTKPSFIVIEDLNVSGMMKNKHLSKAVKDQKLYEFRVKLKTKCGWYGIELRVVSRWYPSSKMCHNCGSIKKDLKLSDRTYNCNNCGYIEDRDLNASLNLRDAKTYKTA